MCFSSDPRPPLSDRWGQVVRGPRQVACSEFCEGLVVALSVKDKSKKKSNALKFWMIIEHGDESIDGSSGSVILDGGYNC